MKFLIVTTAQQSTDCNSARSAMWGKSILLLVLLACARIVA